MTKRELTSLALKFAAIYVLISLLTTFSVLGFSALNIVFGWYFGDSVAFYDLGTTGRIAMIIIGLLAFGLPALMARLLWKLANRLVDETQHTSEEAGDVLISNQNTIIMVVGVGIWLAISSLPTLFNSSFTLISLAGSVSDGTELTIDASTTAWFLGSLLEFILGISLIVGRQGWARLLFRFRYASTK